MQVQTAPHTVHPARFFIKLLAGVLLAVFMAYCFHSATAHAKSSGKASSAIASQKNKKTPKHSTKGATDRNALANGQRIGHPAKGRPGHKASQGVSGTRKTGGEKATSHTAKRAHAPALVKKSFGKKTAHAGFGRRHRLSRMLATETSSQALIASPLDNPKLKQPIPAFDQPLPPDNTKPNTFSAEFRPAAGAVTPDTDLIRDPKTSERSAPGFSALLHNDGQMSVKGVVNIPGLPTDSWRPLGQSGGHDRSAAAAGLLMQRNF